MIWCRCACGEANAVAGKYLHALIIRVVPDYMRTRIMYKDIGSILNAILMWAHTLHYTLLFVIYKLLSLFCLLSTSYVIMPALQQPRVCNTLKRHSPLLCTLEAMLLLAKQQAHNAIHRCNR